MFGHMPVVFGRRPLGELYTSVISSRVAHVVVLGLGYAIPIAIVLALFGFWPGLAPPALAWMLGAGSAQCIAEEPFVSSLTSHCSAVGLPVGQPQLQGLPQTYAAAWLSELPWIDAWDAYKVVGVLTTIAGFLAFAGLLRRWSAPHWIAILGAYSYLSSITLLALNGFTFTFHGYVLLPAYCLLALRSIDLVGQGRRWAAALIASTTSLLMVFTDGYSFVGAVIVIVCLIAAWMTGQAPVRVKLESAAVWAASLLISIGAYYLYTPRGSTETPVGLGAFRFLGLDVITLIVPAPTLWWAHWLGIGDGLRNLWGDGSNVIGNYLGVSALVLAVLAVPFIRHRSGSESSREVTAVAVAGLVALVLSLGPALKVARETTPIEPRWDVPLSETTMWLPTSLLYEHVPAFSSMRATYRSFTVTRLALVAGASIGLMAVMESRGRRVAAVLAALLVVEMTPNLSRELHSRTNSADHVAAVRREYLPAMTSLVEPDDRVLVLPSNNDFLASATIPFTDGQSFNVGIGKNYALSRQRWPDSVQAVAESYGRPNFGEAACAALSDDVDVIVLTYVPLHQGGYRWPADEERIDRLKRYADTVATDRRFEITESRAGLALRPGPGCGGRS